MYCFCCKLFSKKTINLNTEGFNAWHNATKSLGEHERSADHNTNMASWRELEVRLAQGTTIDRQEMALAEAERNRWHQVLTRLVAIIQSLAERNLAFRGHTEKLNTPGNGNFLKEVELMAKFDPVMMQHVSRVEREIEKHTHYLDHDIQNELIDIVSSKILQQIVADVKNAKYFSIILDCTPDLSHKEQLSVILRIVSLDEEKPLEIKEHFIGFFVAPESTGEGLTALILEKMEGLNIPFEDCRGQSYDNGANMKGKNKGVQARLLQQNTRAFFVACAAHTLNLVVADAGKSSPEAVAYFGYLQKMTFCSQPQLIDGRFC